MIHLFQLVPLCRRSILFLRRNDLSTCTFQRPCGSSGRRSTSQAAGEAQSYSRYARKKKPTPYPRRLPWQPHSKLPSCGVWVPVVLVSQSVPSQVPKMWPTCHCRWLSTLMWCTLHCGLLAPFWPSRSRCGNRK